MPHRHGFGTRAVHAGQHPDPTTGAVMPPIYMTSTFAQESPGVSKGPPDMPYDYSRAANPTRTVLEANLASLEHSTHAIAFSSGCAALAALLHTLQSGDHVVLGDDVYGGTFRVFERVFKQFGIGYTQADVTDVSAVERAMTPATKLVWLETPTNPLLKIADIAAIAKLTRSRGARLAVDNTFATPYLQAPLALGADVVCHSATKYLGGHSDIIGGALITSDDALAKDLHFYQKAVGAVPSPFDCFLLLRSTKTLHLRMARHCESAMHIARHLEKHTSVEHVIYPGLASHPQHDLAKRQMCGGYGGMISLVVKGGLGPAKRVLERVEIFTLAESLGGVESLIEHPGIMTHASIPADLRAARGIHDGLIRLSIGVEDPADLIADLDQALAG
ncbi:MAG: cystathionine gamma-synthase [Phycisphaerales bacterium]|jgi:cystathionine gamma-lyase|nr:cystathionine gamma-synthase [Phycisphaerales bacterium]